MNAASNDYPTYGELIDLLDTFSDEHLLCEELSKRYPSVVINRPGRMLDSISRIAAPTKPALNGTVKLTGTPLRSYRKRVWEPRIRRKSKGLHEDEPYPATLVKFGLTKNLLISTLSEIEAGNRPIITLKNTFSTIGFFRELHHVLKQQFRATKTTVGKLYCTIDSKFNTRRPDNVFRFVERVVSDANRSSEEMMPYRCDAMHNHRITDNMLLQLRESSENLDLANSECAMLKSRYDKTKHQLKIAREKIRQLKCKNDSLKDECISLQADLLESPTSSDNESDEVDDSCNSSTLQSVIGSSKKFSPEIRKLYYNLISEGVPISKIDGIIRHVLKCFNPTEDIDSLQLPARSCATYMRKEELSTICDAQKATLLSATQQIRLNTDGTTLNQHKLGGVVANDIVLGVHELQDGSAASAIDDISREFENLRQAAHVLELPNPDSINWTLVVSSSSDSAATQKLINKRIEECRLKDEERFGPATVGSIDLIESFCSMHLGTNLRKAFLSGLADDDDNRYFRVDVLVHEFCKLFGTKGVPEYGVGLSFFEFLHIKVDSSSDDSEQKVYYQHCTKVHLHRQVGNRYFVTAANCCKMLFLRNACIEYLYYANRVNNKLERDVLHKLENPIELAHARVDFLMYYHVYADLYILSKSNDLSLSAFDMNQHYLELSNFITEEKSKNQCMCC